MAVPRWYTAVLLFQSQVGDAWEDQPLVDHSVRLVRASDPEDAYHKAMAVGEGDEHSYANEAGQQVSWRFLGLHDLDELLDVPAHGSEVHSWLTRGRGEYLVREKGDLTVFAKIRDAHKTADELLDE
jgi:hypothetical protein